MKLYWTDIGARKIQRSDLDGSNVEDLVLLPPPAGDRPSPESDFQEPQGVAIDPDAGKMYWINLETRSPDTEKLQRANLNGSGVEDLLVDERRGGRDIAMVCGVPHWFARYANEIRRCGLDGSSPAMAFDTSSRTADMRDTAKAHLSMAADEGGRMLFVAFGGEIVRVALTRAPVVLAPVTHGSESVSGACDEPDGTSVQVFVNGEASGAPAPVLGGEWRKEHIGPLRAGDKVMARAQAPEGTWSLDSGEVAVEFVRAAAPSTTTAPPPATTTAPPGGACVTVVSGLTLARGVAVDPAAGKLYWVDGGADRVQRSNLDGSGLETLAPRGFRAVRLADGAVLAAGFASERAAGEWLAAHHPSEPSAVVEGPVNPQRIALDAAAGMMYWTESGGRYGAATGRIVRLAMDGSGIPEAVVSGLDLPQGIAIGPDTPPAPTTTTAPPATTTTTTTTAPPAPTTTAPPPATDPPTVSEPIYDGETAARGASAEADGTVIQTYRNGDPHGSTTTVASGAWTQTGMALAAGDTVKARATAPGKLQSGFSNEVVVLPLDAWGDPCGCEPPPPCGGEAAGTHQLTLAAGEGGAVLPAPGTTTRRAGERVRLTAIPAAGWAFARWRFRETAHSSRRTTPPISNSTDPSAVYVAEQDAVITAEFAPV